MFDFSSSPLLARRTSGERRFRLWVELLLVLGIAIFIPLFSAFIPGTAASLILGFNGMLGVLNDALSSGMSGGSGAIDREALEALTKQISESDGYRVAELYGEAWVIAAAIFVGLAVHRRSLATMGIEKTGAAKRYGLGFLFGVLLCSAAILLSVVSRASTFDGLSKNVSYSFLFFFLLGYAVQGAAEEILIHGLLLTSLARGVRWLPAVLISALTFVFLHAANGEVTVLALLNVFLFGTFLGLFTIRTGSVIGAAALHAAWNFTEGQLFGCSVSGFDPTQGLFAVTADASRASTNGGAFGPEGGLAATMVLMLALIAVLFLPTFGKKRQPTP